MYEVKRVKSAEIFPVVQELLGRGGRVWITVTGMSMFPFLREDRDKVELVQASLERIKRGDIVLIRRKSGQYVLHRVVSKEGGVFYIAGDAQKWIEGPITGEMLLAVVEAVKYGEHLISCKAMWWRFLSAIWLNIIPVRCYILRGLIFVRGKQRYIQRLLQERQVKQ